MITNSKISEILSAIYEKESIKRDGHYIPVLTHIVNIDGVSCGLLPELVHVDIDKYFDLFVSCYEKEKPDSYVNTCVIAVFDTVEGIFINFKTNCILFDNEMVSNAIIDKETKDVD